MTTPVTAQRWTNWAGNQQTVSAGILTPGTVDEVAAHVKEASGSGRRIKAVGTPSPPSPWPTPSAFCCTG